MVQACVSTFPQPAEPFTCCGKLISKDKELSLCPYKLPTTFPEPCSHGASVHLSLHALSSDVPHYGVPRVSHSAVSWPLLLGLGSVPGATFSFLFNSSSPPSRFPLLFQHVAPLNAVKMSWVCDFFMLQSQNSFSKFFFADQKRFFSPSENNLQISFWTPGHASSLRIAWNLLLLSG